MQTTLGLNITLQTDFDSAIEQVTNALKKEGFGVLTEIDVKETLKQKLNVDFRPYKILGACNPALAHRALSQTPEAGLLLPCNVTVTQVNESHVQVSIVDPLAMMQILQDEHLNAVAQLAHERLNRVIAALEQTTDTDMRESTSLKMHHGTND